MREGILVVKKLPGMTSHDVVELVRRKLGMQHIGHGGTLDPMASGVLVLLIGGATKQQRAVQSHRKWYEAVIRLGIQTDTADAWGKVLQTSPVPRLIAEHLVAVLASCVGLLTQVPPVFSAVKVQGRPLYWWARHGKRLTAAPRTVEIFTLELLELLDDRFRCRIECSAGTYIRTLAETIAERLGTVGHVSELVRLAVGPWGLAQAHEVPWLKSVNIEEIWAAVIPVAEVPRPADGGCVGSAGSPCVC